MKSVYIGLGSNLGDPVRHIQAAFVELTKIPMTTLVKTSSLYSNPPIGMTDAPHFINAVAELKTQLSAEILLEKLFEIEKNHGRTRDVKRYSPRTLDLDILLYDTSIISTPHLSIPHPHLKQRAFVLYPLSEIAPDLVLPCGMTLQQLLLTCSNSELEIKEI